jgi:hypothetical protein
MTAARHQASPLEEEVKEDMKNMNDRNDGRTGREGRTRRPLRRRAGALAAVLTGTALLAAACSGSPAQANTFAPGATYAQTLAFAKCMRANGVPNFPNPDRQGNFNNNNPEIQAMDGDGGSQQGAPHTVSPQRNVLFVCRSVLPNAGTGLTLEQMQQISQQNLRDAVQAAKCMRRHGITNFPDPVLRGCVHGLQWRQGGRRVYPAGVRTRPIPRRVPVRIRVTAPGFWQRPVSAVNRHRPAPVKRSATAFARRADTAESSYL